MTTPYRPSNGSEGDYFATRYCEKCARPKDWEVCDLPKEDQPENACDRMTRSFWLEIDDPKYPAEWVSCGACGPVCMAFISGHEVPESQLELGI